MPRFKITVDTGFPGAQHTDEVVFDDAEWAAMTEEEREKSLHLVRCDSVWNYIDVWSEEIPDEGPDAQPEAEGKGKGE